MMGFMRGEEIYLREEIADRKAKYIGVLKADTLSGLAQHIVIVTRGILSAWVGPIGTIGNDEGSSAILAHGVTKL